MGFSYDDSLSRCLAYDVDNQNNDSTPSQWFVQELRKIYEEVDKVFENPKEMTPLTDEEEAAHHSSTICYICEDPNRPFDDTKQTEKRVYEHSHLTGTDSSISFHIIQIQLEKLFMALVFLILFRFLQRASTLRM